MEDLYGQKGVGMKKMEKRHINMYKVVASYFPLGDDRDFSGRLSN